MATTNTEKVDMVRLRNSREKVSASAHSANKKAYLYYHIVAECRYKRRLRQYYNKYVCYARKQQVTYKKGGKVPLHKWYKAYQVEQPQVGHTGQAD